MRKEYKISYDILEEKLNRYVENEFEKEVLEEEDIEYLEEIKIILENKAQIIKAMKNDIENELSNAETEYDLGNIASIHISDIYARKEKVQFECFVYFTEDKNAEAIVRGEIRI